MEKQELTDNVKTIISTFLKKEGAYSNGYTTYVKGTVVKRSYGSLDWHTPPAMNLTLDRIKMKGIRLYEEILKELEKIEEDWEVEIISVDESGCYTVLVRVNEPFQYVTI